MLANALLGFVQEARAANAVAPIAQMTAVNSAVVRDGRLQRVPSAELVRGDLLMLGEGDSVGADARLLSAAALRVQETSPTGESQAAQKDAAVLPAPATLGDRTCMVFKGTAVAQGTGRAVVMATGMAMQTGAIALSGTDMDRLDDAAFAEAVRHTSVFTRVAPEHKLRIVGALQADAQIVAMTADGVEERPR